MSDYTKTTNFTAKDNLTTGDPLKVIKGSYFDTEFDNIATAVATKYDSDNLASQAQAEAGSGGVNTVLMTPVRVGQWAAAGAGMLDDIWNLADPNADMLLGWDDSAGAIIGFTFGDGLEFSGGTVRLEHLGIGDLEDPNDDRILFWDDSAGATAWLNPTNGIEISTTSIQLASTVAGTGLSYSSGVLALDASELTTGFTVANVVEASDGIVISDGGNMEVMQWNDGGVHVETWTGANDTQDDTMYGLFMLLTGTTDRTFTFTSTGTAPHTGAIILLGSRDTATLNLAVGGTAVFTSYLEQGGTTARSIPAGGTAMAVHVGSDEWMLVGDIR